MGNKSTQTDRILSLISKNKNTSDMQQLLSHHWERINKLILLNSKDYISLITFDATIIYISPSFINLGYKQQDLISQSIINYIHPNDIELLYLLFTDYEKLKDMHEAIDNYNRTLRCRFLTKSGEWIETETNINILADESGNPFAFLLVTNEVARQNHSFNELKEWTDTFDTFVVKFDINGFVLFCNASLLKLGGISEKDLYGKYFPDSRLLSHSSEEKAKIIKCLNNSKAFLPNRVECSFLGADNNPVPAIFNCQPVMDEDGHIKYITGEGKSIVDEINLRLKLLEANENLEKRVKERTAKISEINERLKKEILVRKKVDKALRRSKERFKDITYSMADIVWEINNNGIYTFCSDNICNLYGYTNEEIIGNTHKLLLESEDAAKWDKYLKEKIAKKEPIKDLECISHTKKGEKLYILINGVPMLNEKGEIIGYRGVDKDITQRKIAEEENIKLAAFPRESPHPILSSNPFGDIIYQNPAARRIIESLYLDSPVSILPKDHKGIIKSCLKDKKSYHNIEFKVKGHVFSWTYNPIPDISLVHLHGLDITEQKYFEEKLLHDALHDKLTGLPNRSFFNDELIRALKISKRRKDYRFAVLFMDLGRFKLINDSLGHIIGDKVLVEVANRLASCIRPEDTAARFGGDEFTILLNNITDTSDPVRVAERIQKNLSIPLKIEGHDIFPTASIGIAMNRQEYTHPEDLLRDSNTAMFRAKAEGLSRYVIFDKTMHKQAIKLLELESNLQYAIERKEFCIHYQPIVSLENGKIVGFEALLRWLHPKQGIIYPDQFIPTIEETGQIIPVGEWVLRKSCSQLRNWHKKFPEMQHLFISVNLSAKQFKQPDLIQTISGILDDENLYPGYLNLEITETVIMENYEKISAMLLELREMDVQLGIDDFGIGYSSLSHLHRFPIQTLKIDRSFIKIMGDGQGSSVIPHTIISLGKHLDIDVIAEGVETADQFSILTELECGFAQGNYLSPPVDTKSAEQMIIKDPKWK